MRTWSDQQLARFATTTITLGAALISAGLIAALLPWHVALLALLLVARPTRDPVRRASEGE